MAGNKVAKLPVAALAEVLGESVEVRKSQRAARYPLYLRVPWGIVPMNSRAAQDFILENAVFDSPEKPGLVPVVGGIESPDIPGESADIPKVEGGGENTGKVSSGAGFWGSLGVFD